MQENIVSAFDAASWNSHGLAWARALKSLSLSGVVVDYGIPHDGRAKLDELGLTVVPGVTSYCRACGQYESILAREPASWLFCRPDYKVTADVRAIFAMANGKLVCQTQPVEVFSLVFPIAQIEARVRYASMIEGMGHPPLSANLVCGPHEQWATFVGFFRYCLASKFLDSRAAGVENLAINLFSLIFDGSVEVV